MESLLIVEDLKVPFDVFFNAVSIYIRAPNAVNKKICGSVIEKVLKVAERLPYENPPNFDADFWNQFQQLPSLDDVHAAENFLVIAKILPKDVDKRKSFHIGCHYFEKSFTFFRFGLDEPGLLPQFMYEIRYVNECFEVLAEPMEKHNKDVESYQRSVTWIQNVLAQKISKWMSVETSKTTRAKTKSLTLVDVEEYSRTYVQLKAKYGPKMLEIWPECTDPQKFVYEDIAIASYLLLLWRTRHGDKKMSFVDLGCGNGLLVFILAAEGHNGLGIDLRSRKIWSLYPDNVQLKVETIIPATIEFQTDYVIGNHSDELSPWIPHISARNNADFFLLPCCAFELNGDKFKRRQQSKSVYEDFIDYAMEITKNLGFTFDVDRLKIPSTKRIAIVSNGRANIDVKSFKVDDFKPRDVKEKVTNCTTIDKGVETAILLKIFHELLTKKRFLDEFPNWNIGGSISLHAAIKLVPEDLKKCLKSESGGLQTLLRNNHSIFEVRQGVVQVRKPISLQDRLKTSQKSFKFNQKPCWFLQQHPNGCPFTDELCSYKH